MEDVVKKSGSLKEGFKTSEFWLTLLSSAIAVVGAIKGVIPAQTAAIALAILNGIYTTMRSVVKIKGAK